MGDVAVAVSDVDDGLNERLDDEIYAFNAAATGLDDGRLLRVAVRGSDAELLAGLCGWTWGGCGYVESLWVRADQRGSGLGTRVLVAAEEEVRRRGCEQMALSAHSFRRRGSTPGEATLSAAARRPTRVGMTRSTW